MIPSNLSGKTLHYHSMSRSATYPARARGRGRRILLEFFGATDAAGGIGVDGGGRAMPELGQDRRRRPRIGWGQGLRQLRRGEKSRRNYPPPILHERRRDSADSLSPLVRSLSPSISFGFFFCFYRFSVFSQFTHFFVFLFLAPNSGSLFPLVRIFSRSIFFLIPLIFYRLEYSTLFQIWNVLMFYLYRILIFLQHYICIVF